MISDRGVPMVQLYGGEYRDNAASLFPPELTEYVRVVSEMLIAGFPKFRPADHGSVNFALVNHGSMNIRVHALEGGGRIIIMPVGILMRVYWIAHAVLEYWLDGPNMLVIGSPLDDLPSEWYEIIGPLKPLFAEYDNDSDFWTGMTALAPMIKRVEQNEDDVRSMTRICFLFLFWHELAHLQLGHFGLRKNPMLKHWREWMGVDEKEFEAGLESQADRFASRTLIGMLVGEIMSKTEQGHGLERMFGLNKKERGRSLERIFNLATVGIMLMLGTFWPAKKFIAGYKGLGNQHPLVRREMIVQTIENELAEQDTTRAELWKRTELASWEQVVWATNRMSMNAHQRYQTEGKITVAPLFSSLSYGSGYAFPFIEAHQRRAVYLLSAADGILEKHNDALKGVPEGVDPDKFLEIRYKAVEEAVKQVEKTMRGLKKST